MNNFGYFIDIERFTKWLYANLHYVGDEASDLIAPSTCKNWLRYEKMPADSYIHKINALINPPTEKFDKINIADLLICVNNAIDINRGQHYQTITSTGKKVMVLLLMGRVLDGTNKNGFFTATKEKDPAVWDYLTSFSKSINKVSLFYYLPGRTISLDQLKSVGKSYRNGMKETAIPDGIKELERVGLVSCVDRGKELYKLDFSGCKAFLQKNK